MRAMKNKGALIVIGVIISSFFSLKCFRIMYASAYANLSACYLMRSNFFCLAIIYLNPLKLGDKHQVLGLPLCLNSLLLLNSALWWLLFSRFLKECRV